MDDTVKEAGDVDVCSVVEYFAIVGLVDVCPVVGYSVGVGQVDEDDLAERGGPRGRGNPKPAGKRPAVVVHGNDELFDAVL